MTTTSIEWIANPDGSPGKTWNPVNGCAVVSPGCVNCYAKDMAARFAGPGKFYEGLVTIKKGPKGSTSAWTGKARAEGLRILTLPFRWRSPQWVFTNSMSDLFYQGFSNEQIAAVYGVMAMAFQHTYVVLTKRSKRRREWFAWVEQERGHRTAARFCADHTLAMIGRDRSANRVFTRHCDNTALDVDRLTWPLPNVIEGVSVEDQARWDERVPDLIATPAATRMVSVEPMLGPINAHEYLLGFGVKYPADCRCGHGHGFTRCPNTGGIASTCHRAGCKCTGFVRAPGNGIHWVVVGCESGKRARACEVQWLRNLRDQCVRGDARFFLKQGLETIETRHEIGGQPPVVAGAHSTLKGRGYGGRVIGAPYLDGRQWLERPEVPRV